MKKNKFIWVGILAGVLFMIIGYVINFIFGIFFPAFQEIYTNTDIFLAMDQPRGLLFFFYPLASGIALAWVFLMIKDKLDLSSPMKASLRFAWIYFVIAALPAFFINAGSFNLPVMMVVSWTIMSYSNGLIAGLLFSKMLK